MAFPQIEIPFDARVKLGLLPGWRFVRFAGHNNDIDAGTEDIWSVGGTRTAPTAAAVLAVASDDNTNDKAGGTGALTMMVEGLDGGYAEISEIITLNGTTTVNSVATFLRVTRAYVLTTGSNGANTGNITIQISSNTQCYIPVGFGESKDAFYTVPAGYSYYVSSYRAAVGRMVSADMEINGFFRLYSTQGNNSYLSLRCFHSTDMSEGTFLDDQEIGLLMPERTDILFRGVSSGSNVAVSVHVRGYLINNAQLQRELAIYAPNSVLLK